MTKRHFQDLRVNHGNLDAADHIESLRTHPVLSFLFNQRGGIGPATVIAEFDGNGQSTNLQSMSANELYLASYAKKPAGASRWSKRDPLLVTGRIIHSPRVRWQLD